ncbi:hypothetical protein EI77_00503 [Prosthecobacter fusiformis]|uniref:Uncharacterized protein n=1 Tax=Prosthecobacter fusiformis TaxID=48464 RepID=A0A4R7SPR6_9BACT|nr:hypothetical protein [Prosthecobacter fusiformis]TDU81200.1 hypothetical protein EI77_00503 [Prosthecobacter fusiformis]
MPRFTHLLLTALAVTLAGCYGPEPRPFAGQGRSLDQPPRYGDSNRYVEPIAPGPLDAPIGPINPPVLDSSGAPIVDPGLTLSPQPPTIPGGTETPPVVVVPPPTTTTPTTPVTPPPSSDVPFARAVPGKPGFVYSPKDSKKIISVEGLRAGQKARDPETGDIFRVPY